MILDTRNQEKTAEELTEAVKAALTEVGAEISNTEDLGRREFARVTDRNMVAAQYVEFALSAPATFNVDVREKFRLDKSVYRIIVQNA